MVKIDMSGIESFATRENTSRYISRAIETLDRLKEG